ncbi:MAG: hypothetical protein NDJ90_04240 [Oligoflexia bacterium]|nr:hypothetical protein [Oligoflexia bacterium]
MKPVEITKAIPLLGLIALLAGSLFGIAGKAQAEGAWDFESTALAHSQPLILEATRASAMNGCDDEYLADIIRSCTEGDLGGLGQLEKNARRVLTAEELSCLSAALDRVEAR